MAAKVDVDLASKKVRIETGADWDAVRSAIENAGYQVTTGSAA
jgi:copper chaperone